MLKVEPKTKRGIRHLAETNSKLVENTKTAMYLTGPTSSEINNYALHDLSCLKKPDSLLFTRKHKAMPFEDVNPLESLLKTRDSSLFTLATHSKKRPFNLVMGRTFDGVVLDMIELGIKNMKTISSFSNYKSQKGTGQKPLFVFQGDAFDKDSVLSRLRSLILDTYRGDAIEKLALKGIDHVISVSATEKMIYFRAYSVTFMKSQSKLPRIELKPMGPFFDWEVRRSHLASADHYKEACKSHRAPHLIKKKKNILISTTGDKMGRIHVGRQDIQELGRKTKRLKALRMSREEVLENAAKKKDE